MTSPTQERVLFGFWLYILSDCVLFAGLFATFAVLRGATFGGPNTEDLLNLPFVLGETLVLLTSSFAMGVALLLANSSGAKQAPERSDKSKSEELGFAKRTQILVVLGIALALGLVFLGLELSEFRNLIIAGNGPSKSGFMSAFFALVGTHGLHVALGSVWILTMMAQVANGISDITQTRLMMLGMFWHFLDVIWICIFTLVYLLGATL